MSWLGARGRAPGSCARQCGKSAGGAAAAAASSLGRSGSSLAVPGSYSLLPAPSQPVRILLHPPRVVRGRRAWDEAVAGVQTAGGRAAAGARWGQAPRRQVRAGLEAAGRVAWQR